jgi:hypothetical protein
VTDAIPRTARGRRPRFHEDSATDRLITIILALTSEVSVLRDRLDTVELLGERAGWLGAGSVDVFVADQATRERREAAREAYLGRVLHILRAEVEGLERDEDYWATIDRIERGDD